MGTQYRKLDARAATGKGGATLHTAGDWLSFAAAPTFAGMALLTGISGGDMPDMICSAEQGGSLLGGMAVMYWLMCAFHLAPWLRLISSRRMVAR